MLCVWALLQVANVRSEAVLRSMDAADFAAAGISLGGKKCLTKALGAASVRGEARRCADCVWVCF